MYLQALQFPPLRIEAPTELAAVRERLESIDLQRFAGINRLVGAVDVSEPIRIILATETSDVARSVPSWIAGFAVEMPELIVIFPARSPSYPDRSLEDVLRHEIAHVFIRRAASGHDLPRWFNEGLAMAAERERRLEDQTRLLYQLVAGSPTTLAELNRLFSGGPGNQNRAYALSGALVHDILERHGSTACKDILTRVGRGVGFDAAFTAVTGSTPAGMESEFWRRQRIWTSWVPIISSSTVLWLAITLLAILAIFMRRRRNRQIEQRWAEEEEGDLEP